MTFAVARTAPPDLVEYDAVYRSASGTRRVSDTLRFVDVGHLLALVSAAGLVVEESYGDWDRSPLRSASPEVVVVAVQPA